MKKLRTVSESIQLISEGHAETDQMTYADGIAKALQSKKTELGNVWTTEIVDGSSDYVTGSGSGKIKYTIPAVPNEVDYHVEVFKQPPPPPTIGEDGEEIPNENVTTDASDVKITVSVGGAMIAEETFVGLALVDIKQTVTDFVTQSVSQHHDLTDVGGGLQKEIVDGPTEKVLNESKKNGKKK